MNGNTHTTAGVYWEAGKRRWRASIEFRGKKHNLGRFSSAEAAARAYDCSAKRLWANAIPNFLPVRVLTGSVSFMIRMV